MLGRYGAAAAIGLVLGVAACAPAPRIDPASFPGGALRVAHGAGADIVLFVNPDGSLAGFEEADAVEGFIATRGALRFEATQGAGPGPLSFDLAAAPFGPDYAGKVAIGGGCTAECTQDASAWWASGKERVTLPR